MYIQTSKRLTKKEKVLQNKENVRLIENSIYNESMKILAQAIQKIEVK